MKKEQEQTLSGATTPETLTGLNLKMPKEESAGIPALKSAMSQVYNNMHLDAARKTLFKLNQKGGIDCPGCAWPDPDDERSKLGEYCENGVKAIAEEASKRSIDADFFAQHSIQELQSWSDYQLGKQGRISEPLTLNEAGTHYESISWEKAFQMVGENLQKLQSPNEAIFYTSGRTSNEAAFLYQLFVREFGTNNLPDCSNMCHESSGKGLSATLGINKGSVTLKDFYEAEVVIVMGQNPGTNHPRMLSALEKCKANGGKIISINPLKEAGLYKFKNPQKPQKILGKGISLADLFLQVNINGDIALLKAIMLLLFSEERNRPGTVFDFDFIQDHTEGYEAFINDLKKHDFNELVNACGVPREQIKQAVELLRTNQKIIICWAMGLTQHENGVANIQELVNLLLLKGSIGKPGAGTCPVRGHSNVQGDRTVGIWETPTLEFLKQLKTTFGFSPPRKHGFSVVEAIKAMYEKEAQVFCALGGNFLSATPDTNYTAQALQNCALTVQVSTKLNRSHLIHGKQALILPCLGRTDQDLQTSGKQIVSTENAMGIVQSSEGILQPFSNQLKSEPAIVAGIAKATLGSESKVDWDKMIDNYDHIRTGIEAVIPGFENYNQRVRAPGGFYLPNANRKKEFSTKSGKAQFTINKVPLLRLKEGQFVMMTIRSHDQFNTTIYGLDDRYRGIYNERRVILMNPQDMAKQGLQAKDVVDLVSYYKEERRIARRFMVVPYDIPERCTASYFPEANVLISINAYERKSKTPVSKKVIISIQKH